MKKLNLDRSDLKLFAWCLSEGFEQNRVVYAYDNSPMVMAISAKIKKICQEVTTLADCIWTDFQQIQYAGKGNFPKKEHITAVTTIEAKYQSRTGPEVYETVYSKVASFVQVRIYQETARTIQSTRTGGERVMCNIFHGKASGKKDKWVRCKLIENLNPNAGLGAARTMTGSSASSMAAAHQTMVGVQQQIEALDDDGEGWVSTSPSASQLRPTSAAAAAVQSGASRAANSLFSLQQGAVFSPQTQRGPKRDGATPGSARDAKYNRSAGTTPMSAAAFLSQQPPVGFPNLFSMLSAEAGPEAVYMQMQQMQI
uniref:Uncharacterized protein n=1 Tax=Chromera velia CCMP2878 TaxID=1169474 RepID=A0A0G4HHK3_9ALVE|eukprot:Cvel_27670.t1-p1 / transcript=Cvel_27670.t1 / gene=Cvel_27670 / organism=Chromera_velia_CCMP2878 / gene_product=hypothetical protein / transcript_product=hypothetical protein / location=Cvel_scaffold3488:10651-12139(+) / protein_length=311 / sequence_SO=supercontig / SO=protein_coding / is_pseudo=false